MSALEETGTEKPHRRWLESPFALVVATSLLTSIGSYVASQGTVKRQAEVTHHENMVDRRIAALREFNSVIFIDGEVLLNDLNRSEMELDLIRFDPKDLKATSSKLTEFQDHSAVWQAKVEKWRAQYDAEISLLLLLNPMFAPGAKLNEFYVPDVPKYDRPSRGTVASVQREFPADVKRIRGDIETQKKSVREILRKTEEVFRKFSEAVNL